MRYYSNHERAVLTTTTVKHKRTRHPNQLKYFDPLPPEVEKVATATVDAAYKVHRTLGPGLLESVYELCLAHELRKRGLEVRTQLNLPIIYEDITIDSGLSRHADS